MIKLFIIKDGKLEVKVKEFSENENKDSTPENASC